MDIKKLCPLKRKPQSPLTGAIEFDICDTEKCAWWDEHNKCCSFNSKSAKNVDAKVQVS